MLEQTELEEQAFLAFKRKYHLLNPAPQKPGALSVSNVGFQFWLYLLTSISAVLLAAMRTVDAFYRMSFASSNNAIFSSLEAALAIFAIEGGLVVYASDKAIKENRDKVKVSSGTAKLGTIIMLLISTVAGVNQSMSIVAGLPDEIEYWMQIILTLSVGIGASFIAYIGGEVIGQQITIMSKGFEEKAKKYDDDMVRYNDSLKASWRVSPEKKSTARVQGSSITNGTTEINTHSPVYRPPVQTEKIYKYLDDVLEKENRVASFSEVMKATETAKSTASHIRSKWMEDRGLLISSIQQPKSNLEEDKEWAFVPQAQE